MGKKKWADKKIKKEIAFKVTKDDKAKMMDETTALKQKRKSLKRDFLALRKEFQSKLETIEMTLDQLSETNFAGERREIVDVIERRNYEKRCMQWIHDGKVVEERDMTFEESQMTFTPADLKVRINKQMVRNPADGEIQEVIRQETSKKTKKSAIDNAEISIL